MRSGSLRSFILRLVMAVLFGVMSVVPAPLRAMAHPAGHRIALAAESGHSTERLYDHGAGGHHHGSHLVTPPSDEPQNTPQQHDGIVICQSAACCIAMAQTLFSAPGSVLLLLGQLAMPPARIIVAVMPEPVVPPPRLPA